MLQFDGGWRFDSPGPIEFDVVEAVLDLINRIAGQAPRESILEHFKVRFAAAANILHWPSSNERFAAEDLATVMSAAAPNAPLFIEAFWLSCEELRLRHPEIVLPHAGRINRILTYTSAAVAADTIQKSWIDHFRTTGSGAPGEEKAHEEAVHDGRQEHQVSLPSCRMLLD